MNVDKLKDVPTYEDYLSGTMQILNDSKLEKEPYQIKLLGREFQVLPNVFSPKYFNDSEIFSKHLPVTVGEEMLEIGPGTGVVSITAIYRGAKKVVAIDINPDAVKNTEINIKKHHLENRMEVRLGDIYDALTKNERFDSIFWNVPFGLVDEKELSDLTKAIYDPGYKSTERFIKEGHLHLKAGGKILIGFSTTLGKLDLLKKFVEEAGMDMRLIYEERSEEVHPVKFEIFEAKLK
ncbi:MAG: methyltransferase [Candidatus Paceibacterota bacterium]|jgi:release factor glutamine methyltransferase